MEPIHGATISHMDHKMNLKIEQKLLSDAEAAKQQELELTLQQALILYRKAIGWSILMSTALVMDGFDLKLIGSLFAQPAFVAAYGVQQADGTHRISAAWQSGLGNGSSLGQVIGLFTGGYIAERFGFRKTMVAALAIVPLFVLVQLFAEGLPQLQVAQFLLGVPLATFQTVTSVYAIEVMPECLRAYLTSYVNACWLIGQLIAAVTLRATLNLPAPWAYRVPFAIQLVWPIPLIAGAVFAPDSPWWLVRQNRLDESRQSLLRLISMDENPDFDVDKALALIIITNEHERTQNTDTSYRACFKGTDLRRTVIVIGCYCINVLSGSTLRAYATYFFHEAGLPTKESFNLSILFYALGVFGLLGTWLTMPYVGRRTLFIDGQVAMTMIFLLMGALGILQRLPGAGSSLAWEVGGLLLCSGFVGNFAVAPVLSALVSEIPSSQLRSKSVVVARFSYTVINMLGNIITSYQLNPSALGWGALAGFFWAGTSVVGCVFTYFYVPEPKGRTVAELNLLFERGVSAREFHKTVVEVHEIANKAE